MAASRNVEVNICTMASVMTSFIVVSSWWLDSVKMVANGMKLYHRYFNP